MGMLVGRWGSFGLALKLMIAVAVETPCGYTGLASCQREGGREGERERESLHVSKNLFDIISGVMLHAGEIRISKLSSESFIFCPVSDRILPAARGPLGGCENLAR
jgi:hypothetical protein